MLVYFSSMFISPFHQNSSDSAPVTESSVGCRSRKSVCWNNALSESERAKRFAGKFCQIYNRGGGKPDQNQKEE